jgi:hypothetical protein
MRGEHLARVGDELGVGRVVDRVDGDDLLREVVRVVLLEVALEMLLAEPGPIRSSWVAPVRWVATS